MMEVTYAGGEREKTRITQDVLMKSRKKVRRDMRADLQYNSSRRWSAMYTICSVVMVAEVRGRMIRCA